MCLCLCVARTGRRILACKAILAARSPYFRALLFGNMSEARHIAAGSPIADHSRELRRPSPPLLALSPPPPAFSMHAPEPASLAANSMFDDDDSATATPALLSSAVPAESRLFQALCGSPFVPAEPASAPRSLSPTSMPCIQIEQWSYAAFRSVITFLVANRFDGLFEDAAETLALADAYSEPKLRSACASLLKSRLDVDNAVMLLIQSDHVCSMNMVSTFALTVQSRSAETT